MVQSRDNTLKNNAPNALNVLRVVATLSVFMLHTTLYEPGINDLFTQNGLNFLFRTPAWSAVWIFYITGGYFAGKGYAQGRYKVSLKDTLVYYKKRLVKVIIPTFCFIFLVAALSFPSFFVENPHVVGQMLLFQYQGKEGVSGISATWYIFALFWFYLTTPIAAALLNRIKYKKIWLWSLLLGIATLNFMWRQYALKTGLEWNQFVYVPAVFNIDLYFGGMIFSYINVDMEGRQGLSKNFVRLLKVVAIFLVVATFVSNCYFYNMAHYGVYSGYAFASFYFPSIWLITCIIYLAAFDAVPQKALPLSGHAIRKNPLRLIDAFASVGFEFYLFHSLVLDRCAPYVLRGETITWGLHIKLLLVSGVITLILSIGYHRIFNRSL